MSKAIKSKVIELSESESGNYFDLTSRICYLDDYNLNGIKLVSNENLQKNIETLISTPVVAYYDYDWDGNEDFRGHEVYENFNGDMVFETSAIGSHLKVWSAMDRVKPVFSQDEKDLECIYATARIWSSRFPNYARVIKRLYNEGKLYSSWELESNSITMETSEIPAIPNPRSTDNWEFLSNCLLGSNVSGAYGETAKVLEISTEEKNMYLELSEALKKDAKLNTSEKDNSIDHLDKENLERSNDMDKIKELEAQLSERDIKIEELSASVAELSAKVAEVEKAEEEKENMEKANLEEKLIKATEAMETMKEEKAELEKVVSELTPFKTQVEAIELEKAEAEKEVKIAELTALATKGGYISKEELETSEEIKTLIAEMDEKGIKVLIAERSIEAFEKSELAKKELETSEAEKKTIETSAKKELPEETKVVGEDVMSSFLNS